jgi:hypothetical protein
MAGTVGTLNVGVNADPTGLTKGFQRSATEMRQFERSLSSASTRLSGSLTMMATHLAIVGKSGPEQLKTVAAAAISMASVFGPGGQVISAIALAGTALLNWHNDAREQAEKTRQAYAKMFAGGLSTAGIEKALNEFDLDPERGGKLFALEAQLAGGRRKGSFRMNPFFRSLEDQIEPLRAARQQLIDLLEDQMRLESDVAKIGREEKETREAIVRSRREERDLVRQAIEEHRALRAEEFDRIRAEQAAGVAELNRATGVTRGLTPAGMSREDAALLQENIRAIAAMAQAWQNAQNEAEAYNAILRQGALQFSDTFARALTGGIKNFRDFALQVITIWQEMLVQMFAMELFKRVFGPLLGGFGGGGGSLFGGSFNAGSASAAPAANVAPAGDTFQVNVGLNVQAMDGASVARVLQASQGEIVRLVIDGMQRSLAAQHAIRGT